jgi:secernin
MVVALGSATCDGHTLFGANSYGVEDACQVLRCHAGRSYALGETVRLQHVELPQARQTFTVLGSQPLHTWGFRHGINTCHLAAGCGTWNSKLPCMQPGLAGTDLVRLALERCRTTRQAFDLITGLIKKYGQGPTASGPGTDNIFLLADPEEAILVEAAGSSWAALDCRQVRAAGDVGLIRQDWQRICSGIADHAIAQGWWHDDGSKLDFSGSLSLDLGGRESALRRWGRATLLLEQHNGSIDDGVFRRLLADHYEGTSSEVDPLQPGSSAPLCRHPGAGAATTTTASLIAELSPDPELPAMAWCAFGPPCASVYLPVFLDGDLPESWTRGKATADPRSLWWRTQLLMKLMGGTPERWLHLQNSLGLVQARIDQETEEFRAEALALKRRGEHDILRRQATFFMQNHQERLEVEFRRIQALDRAMAGTVVS